MLDKYVKSLQGQLEEMRNSCNEMKALLEEARQSWPDHQMVTEGVKWKSRDLAPPKGMIWASDGVRIWIIRGEGKLISEGATSVLYWTEAYIPMPPDFLRGAIQEKVSNYHAFIMNIQAENPHYGKEGLHDAYLLGHKDARHAAAEVALKADLEISKLQSALDAAQGTPPPLRPIEMFERGRLVALTGKHGDITINVNGSRLKYIEGRTITYENVIGLAGKFRDKEHTVTYEGKNQKGSLVLGQSCTAEEGMIFNVTDAL